GRSWRIGHHSLADRGGGTAGDLADRGRLTGVGGHGDLPTPAAGRLDRRLLSIAGHDPVGVGSICRTGRSRGIGGGAGRRLTATPGRLLHRLRVRGDRGGRLRLLFLV